MVGVHCAALGQAQVVEGSGFTAQVTQVTRKSEWSPPLGGRSGPGRSGPGASRARGALSGAGAAFLGGPTAQARRLRPTLEFGAALGGSWGVVSSCVSPPGLTPRGQLRVIEGRGTGTCCHSGLSRLLTAQTRFTGGNPRNAASPGRGDPAYTPRLRLWDPHGGDHAGSSQGWARFCLFVYFFMFAKLRHFSGRRQSCRPFLPRLALALGGGARCWRGRHVTPAQARGQ